MMCQHVAALPETPLITDIALIGPFIDVCLIVQLQPSVRREFLVADTTLIHSHRCPLLYLVNSCACDCTNEL